jgi:hypothetical protein
MHLDRVMRVSIRGGGIRRVQDQGLGFRFVRKTSCHAMLCHAFRV